ncbi:MAG TPA: acyl-CoA dehydrogenase family protein [Polyangiaceae bacterium]
MFFQDPPRLGNQLADDCLLREYLERTLAADVLREIAPELSDMGERAGGELYELSLASRNARPELVQFDPWGRRVDRIRVPDAWQRLARFSAERGLVAIPYERRHGAASRVHQFALVYLFAPSSLFYTCPLAMTDGAARTLSAHRAPMLERAVPRLIHRDPALAWTSGQWMTERSGGSDVSATETVARREGDGFRLHGAKWFTSATTSEMALTLARPEGNPSGPRGLALFYLELRDESGALNGIRIERLKEKLGTWALPTAELTLDGARAELVAGLDNGVRAIVPMLQTTRTWNAVIAVSSMRRGIALARDYAERRRAFGAPLAEKPLHLETLARLEAEFESQFLLAFRSVELLGKLEAGDATEREERLLRLLQPLAKLSTAKAAVAHASEVLELFGGAGYVEDTGLPGLLRDAQVLTIWEGTTNVLSLDVERALADDETLPAFVDELERLASAARSSALRPACETALNAAARAVAWYERARNGTGELEARARSLSLVLAKAYALLLVCEHAEWLLKRSGDGRGLAVASRLALDFSELDVLEQPTYYARAVALAGMKC